MNGETPFHRDSVLETFAAELTLAAYRVALGTRTQGTEATQEQSKSGQPMFGDSFPVYR
jgi:hypothetical protein